MPPSVRSNHDDVGRVVAVSRRRTELQDHPVVGGGRRAAGGSTALLARHDPPGRAPARRPGRRDVGGRRLLLRRRSDDGDAATCATIRARPIHLDDAEAATIAEGMAEIHANTAVRPELDAAAKRKYGYSVGPKVYPGRVWRLRPTTVLAWNRLDRDATRRFGGVPRVTTAWSALLAPALNPDPLCRRCGRHLVGRRHPQWGLPARADAALDAGGVGSSAPGRHERALPSAADRRSSRDRCRDAAVGATRHGATCPAGAGRANQRGGAGHLIDTGE